MKANVGTAKAAAGKAAKNKLKSKAPTRVTSVKVAKTRIALVGKSLKSVKLAKSTSRRDSVIAAVKSVVNNRVKPTKGSVASKSATSKNEAIKLSPEAVIPAANLASAKVLPVVGGELDRDGKRWEAAKATVKSSARTSTPVDPTQKYERGPWDENTSLRLYLRDAVEVSLLTPAQEIELAHRIQAGDDTAREHMVRANLRLVIKIAREYEDFGLPLLDLINEGNIGLMYAVDRFDPTKGAKLSTYAAWWIKQSIRRALSNQSKSIRLPIHIVQELARMRRAEVRLETELGRPALDSELAAELEATTDDIRRWRDAAAIGATSLDAPLGSDPDSGRISDVIADENAAMPWAGVSQETNAELIRELVSTLNQREQTILRRRFALDGGDPVTLEEIGTDFGLTRERIRQLEAAALKKLRDRLKAREAMQVAA